MKKSKKIIIMGNIIEKAKRANWAVGMTKEYQGKTYVCSGFNAKGVPLWKLKKDGSSKTEGDKSDSVKTHEDTTAKNTSTNVKDTSVNSGSSTDEKHESYDAPTPAVEYKTKKPADGVVFHVPEKWQGKDPKTGKLKTYERSTYRKLYADKNVFSDDKLLNIVNGKKVKPELRQLAYEEAMARGISEDKIDPSGRLQEKWDNLKFKMELLHGDGGEEISEDEYEDYDTESLRGMDVDKFMEENFPNGDTGWQNRENPIIQKEFNRFVSLADRQRYDAFLDYNNRNNNPYYETPKEQLQDLAREMYFFLSAKNSPLMISAGGAGAGKTTTFLKVADKVPATIFDPKQHKPGDGDYDIVLVDKDIEDEKEFRNILSQHPGKTIVFDDKDKLLTSTASSTVSLMKSLADGNPDMRLFKNTKTGEQDKFTGQLLFLTNKSMDTLNKDEDHKAIMSRGIKHDIHFTVNETIDILRDRYKTIGDKMVSVKDKQEENEIREKVFNIILNNKDKIDPDKFTVRKFNEALKKIDGIMKSNKVVEEDESAANLFGNPKKWEKTVIQILNKAEQGEELVKSITKSGGVIDKKAVERLKKRYKEDPKGMIELLGDKILEIMNGDDEEDEVETDEAVIKAMVDEMSVTEAEELLFG